MSNTMENTRARKDYFISYRESVENDKKWARWVRDVLHKAGLTTIMQAFDFKRTTDFIEEMHVALRGSDGTIVILSKDYFDSIYCTKEFFNSYHEWAKGKKDLIVLKIDDFDHAGLLSSLLHYEIFRFSEDEERAASFLLDLIEKKSRRATGTASLPSLENTAATPPTAKNVVWNLPMRNSHFVGRDDVLSSIDELMKDGAAQPAPRIVAVHGLGGIGKTQIAAEFAYRRSTDYEIIWWVVTETPEELMAGYTQLLDKLDPDAKNYQDMISKREQLREYLETCDRRWLLVFDNAECPEDLAAYIPRRGNGNILITSREQAWDELGHDFRVEMWHRSESISFLLDRTGLDSRENASVLADKLGDYPLALAQAGAYIRQKHKTMQEYIDLLDKHGFAALGQAGTVRDYKSTVAQTWKLSFDEIGSRSRASIDLLNLLAFFAPDSIPVNCIISSANVLPEVLSNSVGNDLAFDDTLQPLISFAFVEAKQGMLAMHRLVQDAVRENLTVEEQRSWSDVAIKVVQQFLPFVDDDLETWEITELILPHALKLLKEFDGSGAVVEAIMLHRSIGMYWFARGRYKSSIVQHTRARELHQRHFGEEDTGYADILVDMSSPLMEMGEYREALQNCETALEIDEKFLGTDHESVGRDVNNIGEILRRLGEYEKAKPYYERALQISRTAFGANHTNVATALNNLGLVCFSMGDIENARRNCEQALEIDMQIFGPDHPKVAARLANVGGILREIGNLSQARENYQRALQVFQNTLGPTHPYVAVAMNRLGLIYLQQGEVESARDMFESALQISQKVHGQEHPEVAANVQCMGDVLLESGDTAGAREHYSRAAGMFVKILGPDHPKSISAAEVLDSLNGVARAEAD